jgi:benzoate/toluate 1,2-dioxygenase alpha subunit
MIPIHPDNTPKLKSLDDYLIEDKEKGDYRLHRSAFTDEALFELEMKHIFEGNWIYLAHESQIPNNNDYYTTHIGRQPVFIARNRQGELNAFINACSHAVRCYVAINAVTRQHTRAHFTAGLSITAASC